MTATSKPSIPARRIISSSAQTALMAGPGSPSAREWIALYAQSTVAIPQATKSATPKAVRRLEPNPDPSCAVAISSPK